MVVTTVMAFLFGVYRWQTYSEEEIVDGYALHDLALLIIDYVEARDGQWPGSWSELRAHAAVHNDPASWSLDYYEERLLVDFVVDPIELQRRTASEDNISFHVISAKRRTRFVPFTDPNALISEYFRNLE